MAALGDYTQEEFFDRFKPLLATLLVNPSVVPVAQPQAVLLGGQSGAGKSTLHGIFKDKLGGNVVVINGDEYRSLHPRFAQIQERYGIDAPAYTAAWAGKMVESLIDALSSEGYNLVIEGTLRTAEVPLGTARLLRERGYAVSLALMAVKPEISLVSCQIRYEQMRIAGTTPRAVDPGHHAKIVDEIVDNLATLEGSNLFDSVSLYNRAATCLFSCAYPANDTPASVVLGDILFGDWTEEELAHYADLKDQLQDLQIKSDEEGEG